MDDLAARLTAIFLEELQAQVRCMGEDLLALEEEPADAERLRSLFRSAHTLKGAARAAGVPEIEATFHALEELLARVRDGRSELGEKEFSLLFSAVDAAEDAGGRIRAGEPLAGTPVAELARSLGSGRSLESGDAGRAPGRKPDPTPEPDPTPGQTPDPAAPAPLGGPSPRLDDRSGGRVRLEPDKIDALLASAGELLITTGRLTERSVKARALHEHAVDCAATWRRLERRLPAIGEDTAARRAAGSLGSALGALVSEAGRLASEAAHEKNLVSRLAGDLRERMQRMRMRPFADACEMLPRTVRDVAAEAGKEVRLEVIGREVEADRQVLDAVREALIHLVRNAVDHGIEPPELRREKGKPTAGTIAVEARLRGDRLLVTVRDDGAGLDLDAIRAERRRLGRDLPRDEEAIARTLFDGGLSTRAETTSVSGRGVGLNAVRAAVEAVRGRVEVAWETGGWTRFALECPLTLAAVRTVLVRVDGQVLGLPTMEVERLVRVAPDEVMRADGRDVLPGDERPVPLVSLAGLLGPPLAARPAGEEPLTVVRLRSGGRRLAVVVDDLVTEQELLVRPLEVPGTPSPYLVGGALLASGEVALVLDAAAVVAAGQEDAGGRAALERAERVTSARRRIVLADDSITTRTLEQSILEAAGYEVVSAPDGAEAWRIIQEQPCDLVVSDVEMPRMSGFELCEAIRGSVRHPGLPVVLVTALESPEHRARGMEAGADAYVTKSSFEQEELLDTIARLLGDAS